MFEILQKDKMNSLSYRKFGHKYLGLCVAFICIGSRFLWPQLELEHYRDVKPQLDCVLWDNRWHHVQG